MEASLGTHCSEENERIDSAIAPQAKDTNHGNTAGDGPGAKGLSQVTAKTTGSKSEIMKRAGTFTARLNQQVEEICPWRVLANVF